MQVYVQMKSVLQRITIDAAPLCFLLFLGCSNIDEFNNAWFKGFYFFSKDLNTVCDSIHYFRSIKTPDRMYAV